MNAFGVGVPRVVTAVSRFTTARSALAEHRADGSEGRSGVAGEPPLERPFEVDVTAEREDDGLSAETPPFAADPTIRRAAETLTRSVRLTPAARRMGVTIATSVRSHDRQRVEVGSAPVRKGIVQLVAIGVVIGVAVTLVAVLFQWLPTSASEEFDRIQDIYWFATVMSIVIFSLVAAVVVLLGVEVARAAGRRRRRPADPRAHRPRDRVDGGARRSSSSRSGSSARSCSPRTARRATTRCR